MTRKGELILEALLTALTNGGAAITRNVPLVDLSAATPLQLRLFDGPVPQQTEAFLNPPMYEFTMTPFIQIVMSGATNEQLGAQVDTLLAILATITDLGGLITDIRPQPPDFAPQSLFGAPNSIAAEFDIEIDYWSETTAG